MEANKLGGTTIPVDDVKVGKRFRSDMGSIDNLVESIASVGLLHPIVIDRDGNLIAGERRLCAVQRLGWTEIPATIVDLDDVSRLRAEHDENVVRQHFTPSEAVAIAKAIKDHLKTPVGQHADQRDGESFPISGRTRDKAAEYVGMSGRTLEKATTVVEAAEADSALAPIVEEMDRTGKVDPAYQKVKKTTTKLTKKQERDAANERARKRAAKELLKRQREELALWRQDEPENESVRQLLRELLHRCDGLAYWDRRLFGIRGVLRSIDKMLEPDATDVEDGDQ